MAHEVETMMYAGRTPWHGLGQYVGEENVLSKDAIRLAGLDWTVSKHDLYYENPAEEGLFHAIPDRVALMRDSDRSYFATVSNGYKPIQNAEAFQFIDGLVDAGGIKIHTAGSLRGGRRVWILAQLDESFEPVKGDQVDSFVFLISSHDGTMALRAMPTAVRVVCANTARMALSAGAGTGISVTHFGNVKARLSHAQNVLAETIEQRNKFSEFASALASRQVSRQVLTTFTEALFPDGNRDEPTPATLSNRSKVIQLFDAGTGQDIPGVHGTGWGLYNAVTEFANYSAGNVSQERRFEQLMVENTVVETAVSLLGEMVLAA